MEELHSFFDEYIDTEEIEAPIVFKEEDHITLQFCGWSIALYPNDTYILNDTTGG